MITGGGGGKRGVCTVTRLLYAAPNHRAVDSDHRRRGLKRGMSHLIRKLYRALVGLAQNCNENTHTSGGDFEFESTTRANFRCQPGYLQTFWKILGTPSPVEPLNKGHFGAPAILPFVQRLSSSRRLKICYILLKICYPSGKHLQWGCPFLGESPITQSTGMSHAFSLLICKFLSLQCFHSGCPIGTWR